MIIRKISCRCLLLGENFIKMLFVCELCRGVSGWDPSSSEPIFYILLKSVVSYAKASIVS